MMPRVFAAEILKERRFSTADMREDELRLVPNLWDVTEDTEDSLRAPLLCVSRVIFYRAPVVPAAFCLSAGIFVCCV